MFLRFRAYCRFVSAWQPVLLGWLLCGALASVAAPPARPRAAMPAPAAPSLEFIENKGQWDARVRYAAPVPGGRLFLERNAFTYLLVDPKALRPHGTDAAGHRTAAHGTVAAHAYTVHFEGASSKPAIAPTMPTGEVRNYFLGADKSRWASHVGSFRKLTYGQLWPGIDMQVQENATQRLEYDFQLAPRANAARVALRYEGAKALSLDEAGNLRVQTAVGFVTELAPQAWQTDAQGQRQPVACAYALSGTTVRFRLGQYDHQRALTIDPTVIFSSFTGATADNWGFTATYDDAGNMYSGGIVFAPGYPASTGAFSTNFAGQFDIGLIKYNTAANGPAARVWATYLGGGSADFPHSLVVNSQNELVVLGSTSSLNFPTTTGALSSRFGGGSVLDPFGDGVQNGINFTMPNGADLIVSRFGTNGDRLLASTYLGGAGNDGVRDFYKTITPVNQLAGNYGDAFRGDVLTDGAGNIYVASSTGSANFPGARDATGVIFHGGNCDAVVCKLPAALNTVLWAQVIGGNGDEAAYSIQRDAQGRVFVAGGTTSQTFPATAGSFHTNLQGGIDGFALRINADGTQLEKATFIGTAAYDQTQFLQLDNDGDVYLLGQTLGTYPRTAGLYGTDRARQFVQKLDPDLSVSRYSTTFGTTASRPNLVPTAFLVDDCERVYICGWGGNVNDQDGRFLGGTTTGLTTTAGAAQTATDGSDFYLAEFTPGMAQLEYATFLGTNDPTVGEHVDGGTSRFDKRGVVYQAVCACIGNAPFPIPPGANSYNTQNASTNCNNAAFKMDFGRLQIDIGTRRAVCSAAAPIALGGTPTGGVWTGAGVVAVAGGGYQFVPGAVGAGQYLLSYTVATAGTCMGTRTVRYTVAPPITPTFAAMPTQCVSGSTLTMTATPTGGTFSGPGVSGSSFSPQAAGAGTHLLTYTMVDSLGCGTITQQVVVSPRPTVLAGPDTTLCADLRQPFQLRGFSPAGGVWSGTGVSTSGYFTPPNTNNRGGVFACTYTVTQGPCQSTATRTVVLAPTSANDVGLNLPQCTAAPQYAGLAPFNCPLAPVLLAPGATYLWDFGDGSPTSTEATPTHRYERAGSYRIQLTARYANCEVRTGFAPVEVGEVFVPNIITPNGDSLNEAFRPRFSCRPASLTVFSRWGQQVYKTDEYHNNWHAPGLADGIYYYLLRDADDRKVRGWLEVKRQP